MGTGRYGPPLRPCANTKGAMVSNGKSQMGKALDYGSFGVDDRPDRLSRVPDEVLAAIEEEERKNPPATWKEAWERSIDWEIENGVRQL